jgi:hypothetical protein
MFLIGTEAARRGMKKPAGIAVDEVVLLGHANRCSAFPPVPSLALAVQVDDRVKPELANLRFEFAFLGQNLI